MTEGFLEKGRFELGVEKQLWRGKQKEWLDSPEGEKWHNQKGEEDKKT